MQSQLSLFEAIHLYSVLLLNLVFWMVNTDQSRMHENQSLHNLTETAGNSIEKITYIEWHKKLYKQLNISS